MVKKLLLVGLIISLISTVDVHAAAADNRKQTSRGQKRRGTQADSSSKAARTGMAIAHDVQAVVAGDEGTILALELAVASRDTRITLLEQQLAQKEYEFQAYQQEAHNIYLSTLADEKLVHQERVVALQTQLELQENQLTEALGKIVELRNSKVLCQQKEDASSITGELRVQLENARGEIRRLKDKAKVLQGQEIENLAKQLRASKVENSKLQNRISELEEERALLRDKDDNLSDHSY